MNSFSALVTYANDEQIQKCRKQLENQLTHYGVTISMTSLMFARIKERKDLLRLVMLDHIVQSDDDAEKANRRTNDYEFIWQAENAGNQWIPKQRIWNSKVISTSLVQLKNSNKEKRGRKKKKTGFRRMNEDWTLTTLTTSLCIQKKINLYIQ